MSSSIIQQQVHRAHYLADPGTAYRSLRETAPVHWSASAEMWTVTRYADVRDGLRRATLSSRRPDATAGHAFDEISSWMIRLDPPAHTRIRAPVVRAIGSCTTARRRTRVERVAACLLAAPKRAGGMEAIADFASPLAATAIMDLIGLPRADQDDFRRHGEAIAAFASRGSDRATADRADAAVTATHAYLRRLVDERRREPRDDLVSALVHTEPQLTGAEVVGACTLLVLAGHEPLAYAVAHALHDLLVEGAPPADARDAVDELLRYDSPIQGLLRTAAADLTLGRTAIAAGDRVLLSLGAANRDPERFADPDRLDLARRPAGHLAFGAGPHRCPGAALARMTIDASLRLMPPLRLASATTAWEGNALFRHLSALPVLL